MFHKLRATRYIPGIVSDVRPGNAPLTPGSYCSHP
jgi:hypothetical protein